MFWWPRGHRFNTEEFASPVLKVGSEPFAGTLLRLKAFLSPGPRFDGNEALFISTKLKVAKRSPETTPELNAEPAFCQGALPPSKRSWFPIGRSRPRRMKRRSQATRNPRAAADGGSARQEESGQNCHTRYGRSTSTPSAPEAVRNPDLGPKKSQMNSARY